MNPLKPEPAAGLSSDEVADRIAAGLVNRLPLDGWRPYADIVRRNTLTLFNALVVPSAVALFLLADYRGAWAVSGMAVANAVIGLMHELRAKRHLDRLSLLGETLVRVRRDGAVLPIPSGELVTGDYVLLIAGDTVVADGMVVSATYLEVDEALLTGESDPVPRTGGQQIRSGSVCVAGEGAYLAERVGGDAFVHRIAAAARQYRHTPGPTQRTLDRLVQWLTAVAVALCLGYVALYFVRGFPAVELVQMIAATITSMVPQGLVLLSTLAFVLAASRLSSRGAVVQRLDAVEGLAAVDVLCTDKTGTLTTGRQKLDQLAVYAESELQVRTWLGAFANSSVDRRNQSIEALREAFGAEAPKSELLSQLPFQSQNRCSAMNLQIDGKPRLLVLGSFEVLRSQFPEIDRSAIEAAWRSLLPTGLRLMVFADGVADDRQFNGQLPKVSLRPLALIALRDEIRPHVASTLAALASQGIRFKIVSGDHPETVLATVRSIDVVLAGESLTGEEWAASPDRDALAERCDLFGRVSPEQKLSLIECLQRTGRNVGMIGDGVNDILPIKRADFGVAMGSGSQATRAVAGVVLESNDFSALAAMLTEGRRVVQNVRRAAKLFLLKNAYTVVLILVAVGVCGLPFPYLPQQVTLLNVLTIGGPAVLILAGRSSANKPVGSGFFADVGRFVLIAGGTTSTVGLAVYLGSIFAFHHDTDTARTELLTTLIFAGVGNAVVATRGDWKLVAWGAVAVLIFVMGMAVPQFVYFFALVRLTLEQWVAVAFAVACVVVPSAIFSGGGLRAGGNRPPTGDDPTRGGPKACGSPSPLG